MSRWAMTRGASEVIGRMNPRSEFTSSSEPTFCRAAAEGQMPPLSHRAGEGLGVPSPPAPLPLRGRGEILPAARERVRSDRTCGSDRCLVEPHAHERVQFPAQSSRLVRHSGGRPRAGGLVLPRRARDPDAPGAVRGSCLLRAGAQRRQWRVPGQQPIADQRRQPSGLLERGRPDPGGGRPDRAARGQNPGADPRHRPARLSGGHSRQRRQSDRAAFPQRRLICNAMTTASVSDLDSTGDVRPAPVPYIAADRSLPEFTPRAVIIGAILGIVFGASSLYLVLKVGLTVSASIPVAVISITLFRLLSRFGVRDASILENNIVQTAGSAGESIAFGVGVTMPAIMILGLDLEVTRVMLVALLGGLLGILMMIPLRRALIVAQHGYLKYPEGTACAEVLKAGASEESRQAAAKGSSQHAGAIEEGEGTGAKTIFAGLGVGFLYQVLMTGFKGWKEVPEKIFGAPFKAGSISAEISPALLGVGYIIGPRIASIMCAGGVLAYLVLIPAIKFFGSGMTTPLAPGTIPISEMGPSQIRGAYVLYIGAGAVAAGGIISLFRSLPTIWHGLKGG